MSLAAYLAKNYLNADPPAHLPTKKRKRKDKQPPTGISIADDDALPAAPTNLHDDDDYPTTLTDNSTHRTADFRRAAKSSWRTVGTAAPTPAEQSAREAAAAADADAIIASAAADRAAQTGAAADDDAPLVVDLDSNADVQRMESGAAAGLQTAEQVEAATTARRRAQERDMAQLGAHGREAETVYRDASGRRIDIAMKRAAARRAADEEKEKAKAAETAMQGDVQRGHAVERRERLKDARLLTTARYADDAEMNDELKERERWNDPAAGFLVEKKAGKSRTGKPLYKGSAAPNRYGIRPGYRWDGVDRGNGFEGEWFKARNKKSNRAELEYAWQMDE